MNNVRQTQQNIHIDVEPGNWGDAQIENIKKLLIDTASHLNRLLRSPFKGTINVSPGSTNKLPITLYRNHPDDPITIKLTARNKYWAQYAYQFAHEFCHVLSNYEDLKCNPNNWFHEAICELASMYTLRRMAERWRFDPPYPNWASFANPLDAYWHDLLSRPGTQLQEGISLHSWLLDNEDKLRTANYREETERVKQVLVARELFPIFEVTPMGWNANRKYPASKGLFKDYLKDWYLLVDLEDRAFVERISEAFGFPIAPNPRFKAE